MTVNAKLAVCESEADAPVKVMVALPLAAFAAAVNVVLCGVPGVRLSVDGLAVTPAGNPLGLTVIVPLKSLTAVAFTVRLSDEPAMIERLLEESVREKSGCGMLFPDEWLDPHATKTSRITHTKPANSCFLNRELLKMATGTLTTMTLAASPEQAAVSDSFEAI